VIKKTIKLGIDDFSATLKQSWGNEIDVWCYYS